MTVVDASITGNGPAVVIPSTSGAKKVIKVVVKNTPKPAILAVAYALPEFGMCIHRKHGRGLHKIWYKLCVHNSFT